MPGYPYSRPRQESVAEILARLRRERLGIADDEDGADDFGANTSSAHSRPAARRPFNDHAVHNTSHTHDHAGRKPLHFHQTIYRPAAELPKNEGANYRLVNVEVARKTGEDFEHLMRRFKKACRNTVDGQAAYHAARRTHYEKPSMTRHKQEKESTFKQHLIAEATKLELGL